MKKLLDRAWKQSQLRAGHDCKKYLSNVPIKDPTDKRRTISPREIDFREGGKIMHVPCSQCGTLFPVE